MAGTTAPYVPTAYKTAVAQFNQNGYLDFENRKPKYKALEAAIRSSRYLLSEEEIQREILSFERGYGVAPYQIPVIKRSAVTLVDGRLCVLDGEEGETDMVSITFTPKGFRIKVPVNVLTQNYVKAVDMLAQRMYDAWHKWYAFQDARVIAYLETNKSTTLVAASPYFAVSGNAYTGEPGVPFYSALDYVMQQNVLDGVDFYDVASGNAGITRRLMGMSGSNNAINEDGLLFNTDRFYPDMSLMPDAGADETHYLFTPGAFGIYYWVSPNAANNYVVIPQNDFWYTIKDPMFGYFTASVHYQKRCQDHNSGARSGEPVYYDIYEVTVDSGLAKAYSSVNGESPIIKFNLTKAGQV